MLRTRFRFRFVVVCASADMCGHVGACEQVLGGPAVFKNNRRFVLQQKPTASLFCFRDVSLYPYCLLFRIYDQPTAGRASSTRVRILDTETRNHIKTWRKVKAERTVKRGRKHDIKTTAKVNK